MAFITPYLPPLIVPKLPNIPGVPNYSGMILHDDVGVFDSSYNQMFSMARAIKANVRPSSKTMRHPVEDGSIIADFRIIMPVEIELSVICTGWDYANVYQQVKTAFLSGDVYTVTTKADVFLNMIIESIPHEESPDMFDVLPIAIRMVEVRIIETQYQALPENNVADVNDQSTVKTGTKTPEPKTGSVGTQLFPGFLNN